MRASLALAIGALLLCSAPVAAQQAARIYVGPSPGSATNPVPVGNSQVSSVSTSIANGTSLTAAINLGTTRLVRIAMPAAWTAAALTIQVSYDGTTYSNLHDAAGTEYTVQAAASREILLPIADFLGVRWLKIRSGTSAAPVNQGAARTLNLAVMR